MHRKFCKTAGCKNIHTNRSGYCDECNSRIQAGYRYRRMMTMDTSLEDKRPSASERGYDAAWRRFAKKFLLSHPKCAVCGRPAQVVDHKTMTAYEMLQEYGHFILDEDMYQPLCFRCNNRKGRNEDCLRKRALEDSKAEFEAGLPSPVEDSGIVI